MLSKDTFCALQLNIYTFILTSNGPNFPHSSSFLPNFLCASSTGSFDRYWCPTIAHVRQAVWPSSPAESEAAFSAADLWTSCGAALIQPEMRFSWGLMAIASPGENLVLIRDNFRGSGRWRRAGDSDAASLQLVFTYLHLISFKDEKSLSCFSSTSLTPL